MMMSEEEVSGKHKNYGGKTSQKMKSTDLLVNDTTVTKEIRHAR